MKGALARVSRWRRALTVALVVVATGAAAGLAWATVNRDFLMLRFGVVTDNVLYRAKLLDAPALDALVHDNGIHTIVNLTTEDRPGDRDVALARGAKYVWLPSTQVPPPEVVAGFLDVMRDPKNQPVLLHCEHGVGRTGALVGVYRLEFEGAKIEDVLDEARHYAIQGSFQPGSPKTVFLEEYAKKLAERKAVR